MSSPSGRRSASGPRAAPPVDPVDAVDRARQICLNQLEYAPRTRAELAAALRKKGVEPDVADQVLSRFAEVGMIDDALFAEMWVGSRQRSKGLASRAIAQELRRKGVDDASIAGALATVDAESELATARELVQRRLRTTAGLAPDVRVRRLAGMLARKGYPAGTAFRVVREALSEQSQELADALLDAEVTVDDASADDG